MLTELSTRTETAIAVTRSAGGRVEVRHSSTGGPHRPTIRAVIVRSDEVSATVSLVPEGALLLAGDDVRIDIVVGEGVRLDLHEPAGTVAYDMRGGSAAWQVEARVGRGGALVWHGEPFVAAEGSDPRRRVHVTLADDACLALRDVLVLGRHGERSGTLRQVTRIEHESGRPLLVDGLESSPTSSRLAWGEHKSIGSLVAFGFDPPAGSPGTRFDLEDGGALVRTLGEAHLALRL